MQSFESPGTADDDIRKRVSVGKRHELRDRQFLRGLAQYFRPGPILEIGASTGHLAAILQEYGYDVTASEIAPKLVAAIASRGVKATLVDATKDIVAQTGRRFPNILAQAVGPLIYRDRERVSITLLRVHGALEVSGRFICIGPYAWRQPKPKAFFSPREQIEIALASGFFRMATCFPHQIVPPSFYRPWNARLLNVFDHKLAWIASTRLLWVMEKIET
jgi:SAM-dependent methyltransferase